MRGTTSATTGWPMVQAPLVAESIDKRATIGDKLCEVQRERERDRERDRDRDRVRSSPELLISVPPQGAAVEIAEDSDRKQLAVRPVRPLRAWISKGLTQSDS